MPLPGLPYPSQDPIHKSGDESKFADPRIDAYCAGKSQEVVDMEQDESSSLPPFANGPDVRKNYVAPKSAAPGPEGQ